MSDCFVCGNCGKSISTSAPGTQHRNHCPLCLWSLHVADSLQQHDRDSKCQGLMEPVAIASQRDGEWSIVHRCGKCGNIKTNRVAGDDDPLLLLCLALRPLANLPFPLDKVPKEVMAKYSELK